MPLACPFTKYQYVYICINSISNSLGDPHNLYSYD